MYIIDGRNLYRDYPFYAITCRYLFDGWALRNVQNLLRDIGIRI